MLNKAPIMNNAVRILIALGTYCPRVKITNENFLGNQKDANKRRKRPLIGRGNYGRNLRAHFDSVRGRIA